MTFQLSQIRIYILILLISSVIVILWILYYEMHQKLDLEGSHAKFQTSTLANNTIEIQNDGHDPELQGESWSVHNNTFAPKAFAFFCKQFIKEVRPAELTYARTRIYPPTTN